MPKKKIETRKRVNLTLELSTYNELEKLAAARQITIPDLIREHIDQGMTINYEIENLDFITGIIREQLSAILIPTMNRIAALQSKTCIQAATSAYLNAEVINKFVPEKYQEEYLDVYEAARKKAIAYTRNKNSEVDN